MQNVHPSARPRFRAFPVARVASTWENDWVDVNPYQSPVAEDTPQSHTRSRRRFAPAIEGAVIGGVLGWGIGLAAGAGAMPQVLAFPGDIIVLAATSLGICGFIWGDRFLNWLGYLVSSVGHPL